MAISAEHCRHKKALLHLTGPVPELLAKKLPPIWTVFVKQLNRPMVTIIGRIFMLCVGVGISKAPSDEGAVSEAD